MSTMKSNPFGGDYDWKGISMLIAVGGVSTLFALLSSTCMPATIKDRSEEIGKVVSLSVEDVTAMKANVEYLYSVIKADKTSYANANFAATQKDIVLDDLHCMVRAQKPITNAQSKPSTKLDGDSMYAFGMTCGRDIAYTVAKSPKGKPEVLGYATPVYTVELYMNAEGLKSTSYRKDVGITPFGKVLTDQKEESSQISAEMAGKSFQEVINYYKGITPISLPFKIKE